jgi:hypothetical protein
MFIVYMQECAYELHSVKSQITEYFDRMKF